MGYQDHFRKPIERKTRLFIGHRGSSVHYPENTLLAFQMAVAEGAHAIEADIRKVGVGDELIVMHDSSVDRTTNGSGNLVDLDWAYLAHLDAGAWKGEQFAGRNDTKVLTLDQLLDAFNGKPVFLSLQLKLGSGPAEVNDVLKVVNKVERKGMLAQSFVFIKPELAGVVKAEYPRTFVMNDGMDHDGQLLLAQAALENWDAISVGIDHITKQLVADANKAGILVQVSYVSEDHICKMQELIDFGVSFILGDHPLKMVAVGRKNNVIQITPPHVRCYESAQG